MAMPLGSKRSARLPAWALSCSLFAGVLAWPLHAAASAEPAPSQAQQRFLDVLISPDGRWVASVEGVSASSGGAPVLRDLVIRPAAGGPAVTVSLPCGRVPQCWPGSPSWTPDSHDLVFALRTPGSHARSIYRVAPDGSGLTRLLAFDGTIVGLRHNGDGQLAMLATAGANKEIGAVEAGAPITGDLDEAPPAQRIAVLRNGRLEWASPPGLFVYEYDWVPDGRGFVGTAAPGDGDRNWWIAQLYAFDAAKATARVLYTPTSPQQQLAAPVVSHDGSRVAFIGGIMSDFGSTGGDLYALPLTGGPAINLTPQLQASVTGVHWDCTHRLVGHVLRGDRVEWVDFGPGVAAQAGRTLWQGVERVDGQSAALAGSCATGEAAVLRESFDHAAEIEVGPVGRWRALTRANAQLAANYQVQSLNWTSDGHRVQGWLVLPKPLPSAASGATARLPMITLVHGGPAAAFQPGFLRGQQRALLDHGYALFLPNPRGSFGQGAAFAAANVRDFGHGDLRDILSGVEAAVAAGPIDGQRVGLMGHSYGGFMTMWAVSQTQRFKAAVAGAGISNWQSYYGQNGIDEWMTPYFGATVYDDPAVFAKSSPINFIKQVQTPVFSYVGAADIECPAPQTQEFGRALKALGKTSATVIYPAEGHAIHDPKHLADIERRTLDWFDRFLR